MTHNDDEWASFRRTVWEPNDNIADDDEELEHTAIWDAEDEEESLPDDYLLMWLVVKEPTDQRGMILNVPPDAIVGRGRDADVRWDDPRMSRRHARFTLEPNPDTPDAETLYYFVWPQEARNGIEVNGVLIRGATMIQENDQLKMGDTIFIVKLLD